MELDELFSMTPSELEHHGVKGMKWGVRKDRKGSKQGGNPKRESKKSAPKSKEKYSMDEYTKSLDTISKRQYTPEQKVKNLKRNKEKSLRKLHDDPSGKKKLSPEAKKALMITGGVVLAAGVGYVAYKNRAYIGDFIDTYRDQEVPNARPGKRVGSRMYNQIVDQSQNRIWATDNYLTPSALQRGEFKLATGHTFHRLSDVSETSFRGATYSTSNVDDFNRYVTNFRSELGSEGLKHIKFKASKEVKVPSTKVVLDALKTSMEETGAKVSSVDVMDTYNKISGGSFDSPTAKSMIGKLVSQGYSAIVDEMDAGIIGEKPLVIIDPASFTSKTSSALKAIDIKKAELTVKEITNRK